MAESIPTPALASLRAWLFGTGRPRRRLFSRNIRLSGPVAETLRTFPPADLAAFAQLLLLLDADPISNSNRLAVDPPIPGLRWAPCRGYTAVFVFDPATNSIRVASVR